jgi:hypothetical protein
MKWNESSWLGPSELLERHLSGQPSAAKRSEKEFCIEAEGVARSVGRIVCHDWLIDHCPICDELWFTEHQADKSGSTGTKREERNREKQTGNIKEIKEGKRKTKRSWKNKRTGREKSKGTQSRRKWFNKQRRSKKNKVTRKIQGRSRKTNRRKQEKSETTK